MAGHGSGLMAAASALALLAAGGALAADVKTDLAAEARAAQLVSRMTLDEKLSLLHGQFPMFLKPMPAGVIASAGYVPGVARLGAQALHESDASFDVANTGARPGVEVAQVYAAGPGQMRRLIGWSRVALAPGERRQVSVEADPRLLARFDMAAKSWKLAPGDYVVTVGRYAGDAELSGHAALDEATLAP